MKWLKFGLHIASVLVLFSTGALAQDSTVAIPWGDWLASVALFMGTLAAPLAVFIMRQVPEAYLAGERRRAAEQLLQRGLEYGSNVTVGAVRGRVVSVDVGNEVASKAADYVVRHGPETLTKWMGGEKMIREKIIARLEAPAEASLY